MDNLNIDIWVTGYVQEGKDGIQKELAKFNVRAKSFEELDQQIAVLKSRMQDFCQDLEQEKAGEAVDYPN